MNFTEAEANNKKRSRSQNWDENEKAALIHAIRPFLEIIESKKKSTTTNKEKSVAWDNVLRKLSSHGYNRDSMRAREQWQRMKIQAKRAISSYKRQMFATGGGPPPAEPSDIDWEIKDLLPYEFEEDTNVFDSDGRSKPAPATPKREDNAVFTTPRQCIDAGPSSVATDVVQLDHLYTISEENMIYTTGNEEVLVEIGNIEKGNNSEIGNMEQELIPNYKRSAGDSNNATPCKRRKTKLGISEYESKLFELNEKRIKQVMDHAEELHALKMQHEREFHAERMRLLRQHYQNNV